MSAIDFRSTWWQWLLGVLAWVALVLVFFWPAIFGGKALAPLDILDSLMQPWATGGPIEVHNAFTYDAISQYIPYNWSIFQSVSQDGYIGWNPYTHNGTAILENTMLCPGDWHHQLYRLMPFWDAWNTGIMLQFAIAGIGMLLLLRSQKLHPAYALVGIVAFGFYSQFITWHCHRWILGSMCWLPWMIWAMTRSLDAGRKIDIPSIAFTALAFRGGHLQSCLFVVISTALVFLPAAYVQRRDMKSLGKIAALLFTTAMFSSLLCLDVWLETIPTYLRRCPPRAFSGPLESALTFPLYITLLFPLVPGTPDGIDTTKIFGGDIMDATFLGATAFILGATAMFRNKAPTTAKLFFAVGLILPLTPASTWLYHRCTPIFAAGCAWLAAWHLQTLAHEPCHRRMAKIFFVTFIAATATWIIASIALQFYGGRLLEAASPKILAMLPANKAGRADWMIERASSFFARSKIWHPQTLAMHLLMLGGLLALLGVHAHSRHARALAVVIAILTFGETFMYSRTWLTFHNRPASADTLYEKPAWVDILAEKAKDGAVVVAPHGFFDYMQLNTPSVYGIRFQSGYETVMPLTCAPLDPMSFTQEDFAAAGISLCLAHPSAPPQSAISAGWPLVHDSKDFRLYANPAFTSRIVASSPDGHVPIKISSQTANSFVFSVPPGTTSLHIAETYNAGWHAKSRTGLPLVLTCSPRNGIEISFPAPPAEQTEITLRFRPRLRKIYFPAVSATIGILALFSLLRRRCEHDASTPCE